MTRRGEERTQDLPCATLLNLCDVELEEVVEPCDELLPYFLTPTSALFYRCASDFMGSKG